MARILLAERSLLAWPVVGPVLAVTVALYVAIGMLAPRYESQLGSNSSLREVARFLRQHGAAGVQTDRLWAGLHFYWKDDLHFTGVVPPAEIEGDPKRVSLLFETSPQIRPGAWYIHYRKQAENPFRRWTDNPKSPQWTIGDFVVGPLSP
jgi:hypothetical protein